jgi:hypothetical protein
MEASCNYRTNPTKTHSILYFATFRTFVNRSTNELRIYNFIYIWALIVSDLKGMFLMAESGEPDYALPVGMSH